ncbi:phage integrase N-terminal SAM-like domain-containing protein [Flavobacterium covae]
MELKEYLQKKYSKSTLNSNLYNIKRFTDYYQNKAPKATFKEILNYIEHLRKKLQFTPKNAKTLLVWRKNILQLFIRNRTKKRSSLQ